MAGSAFNLRVLERIVNLFSHCQNRGCANAASSFLGAGGCSHHEKERGSYGLIGIVALQLCGRVVEFSIGQRESSKEMQVRTDIMLGCLTSTPISNLS